MAMTTFGDVSMRSAPPRGVLRRAVARLVAAREAEARRRVNAYLCGLDDATLASLGYERSMLDHAGRRTATF